MAILMPDINLRRAKRHLKRYWRELLEEGQAQKRKSSIFCIKSVLQAKTSRAERLENGDNATEISFVEVAPSLFGNQQLAPEFKVITARVKEGCHGSGPNFGTLSTQTSQEAEIEARTDNKTRYKKLHESLYQKPVRADVTARTDLESVFRPRKTKDCRSSYYYLLENVPTSKNISWARGSTLGCILEQIHRNDGGISELDFSSLAQRNKRLEPEGCDLVARSLSPNHTVRKVLMQNHFIGDNGAEALAKMLCVNTTVEYLDLYGNNIGDRGVEALAQALYGHDSLSCLCLDGNLMTDRGAAALAQAARCNRTLKSLQLSYNRITKLGGQALLDALNVNMHLETINLNGNDVPPFVVSQLAAALARNRAESLMLESHAAEEKAVKIVREASGLYTENSDIEKGEEHFEEDWDEDDSESVSSGFLSCSGITDVPLSSSGLWI